MDRHNREKKRALSRDLSFPYNSAFAFAPQAPRSYGRRTQGPSAKGAEVDGGYFGGYVKPPISKKSRLIAALSGTKTASARLW
jgi:hypothetical protein